MQASEIEPWTSESILARAKSVLLNEKCNEDTPACSSGLEAVAKELTNDFFLAAADAIDIIWKGSEVTYVRKNKAMDCLLRDMLGLPIRTKIDLAEKPGKAA